MGLEFLQALVTVVDECEARALAAAVLRPEAEAGDLVLVGFVQVREQVAQFVLAHVRAAGVQDVTVKA